MSQPPPLPTEAPLADPIPIAEAVSEPADFRYAEFRAADYRPGGATTLGIASLVIAIAQIGFAVMVCVIAFSFWIISQTRSYATTEPARPKLSDGLVVTRFASAGLAALLGVPLLIAGILTLRGRRAGRWLHLTWAWLKLPVAIAGAVCTTGFLLYWADADAARTGTPRDATQTFVAYLFGSMQGLLSVGYIFAVMIVMRTARVRAWFTTHA